MTKIQIIKLLIERNKTMASQAIRGMKWKITGLRTGSGQTGFSEKGREPLYILPQSASNARMWTHVATFCNMSPYLAPHFSRKVHYGELRHFCDDPVCPGPVWKLSIKRPVWTQTMETHNYIKTLTRKETHSHNKVTTKPHETMTTTNTWQTTNIHEAHPFLTKRIASGRLRGTSPTPWRRPRRPSSSASRTPSYDNGNSNSNES